MLAQASKPSGLPALIIDAVQHGRLKEPFTRLEFEAVTPASLGYSLSYRATVLANNELNGNYETGFFERIAPGKYRVARRLLDR